MIGGALTELTITESEIRQALIDRLASEVPAEEDALILPEFAVFGGEFRADVVVINGAMHCYEVKSDFDTLKRLPGQAMAFSDIFHRATLVLGQDHIDAASKLVPHWWGIWVALKKQGRLGLEVVRKDADNPTPRSIAIASLLWRAELIGILESLGLDSGVRSKSIDILVERLAASLQPEQVSDIVRRTLCARGDWRAGSRRKQYGAKSQRLSSLSYFRRSLYGSKRGFCRPPN